MTQHVDNEWHCERDNPDEIEVTPKIIEAEIKEMWSYFCRSVCALKSDENLVEITDEMIRAGVEDISSYNLDFESSEDAVIRIYRRMKMACSLIR